MGFFIIYNSISGDPFIILRSFLLVVQGETGENERGRERERKREKTGEREGGEEGERERRRREKGLERGGAE